MPAAAGAWMMYSFAGMIKNFHREFHNTDFPVRNFLKTWFILRHYSIFFDTSR